MKFRIFGLVAIAFLGLAITGPTAHAQRVTFAYTGNLVTWTAPATGLYQITAYGAQGGTPLTDVVVSLIAAVNRPRAVSGPRSVAILV